MLGKTISHYKIIETPPTLPGQVGEDGMGVVCKAEDIKLGRKF